MEPFSVFISIVCFQTNTIDYDISTQRKVAFMEAFMMGHLIPICQSDRFASQITWTARHIPDGF